MKSPHLPSQFHTPDENSDSSRFWVEEKYVDSFMNYLTQNQVSVDSPEEIVESDTGKLFELEVLSKIPPERGIELSENFNSKQEDF